MAERGLECGLEGDQKRTVLIADDDRPLAEAIAATLDREGLQTVVTHDGERALALSRALQPDLVLLDIVMPGKSGIEVCAALKMDPMTASIPVILITARADETDRMVGIAAGADECLTKPFSPTKLIALVNDVLAGRPIELQSRQPDLSAMPAGQLVIYARELRELFEREQNERRALEEAYQRLGELDRLKTAFLGAVTNELLTPFAAIGLALQVLQRQSQDSPLDVRDALDTLETAIVGLHRQVNGVVKFAELVNKRREPQPGCCSLEQMIPWAVQPVATLAQARGVDFRVLVPSDLSKVYADPELVGEAVFQMGHNGVKFNLPGGRSLVRAFESEGWVVIEVSDNGAGLTPELLEVLRQPYGHRADALGFGQEELGIGWAFVCYVAYVHGGCTRVESPGPGQGSTFSLALPVAEEAQELGCETGA
jgi:DNA-binding response OmpR family regulator